MDHETGRGTESGIEIDLRIPAHDGDLFKNKSTNDLLGFLSRHRFEAFGVRNLADLTGHPRTTVNRAIDVLEANELVVTGPDGARRSVQINRERLSVPDDPIMQIPQTEFHAPVQAAVERLTAAVDALLAVVLYGSVATGEADRRSDIDLWVLVRANRPENQRVVNEIERDLEPMEWHGDRYAFHIDVEAVQSVPAYTQDVREIVVSGIALHESEDFETVRNLLLSEVNDDE